MGGMHIEERREWAPTEKRADSSNSILITLCALVFTNLRKVSSCKSSEDCFFSFYLHGNCIFFNKKGDEQLAYAPVNPQSEIISFKYLFNSQNKYQSSDFADTFFARISRKLSFIPVQATSGSVYSLIYTPVFSCKHFNLSNEGLFLCHRAKRLSQYEQFLKTSAALQPTAEFHHREDKHRLGSDRIFTLACSEQD